MCKNIASEQIKFGLFYFIKHYLFLTSILPMPYTLAGYKKAFSTSVADKEKIMCGFPVLREFKVN